jgi:magnesium chelatase subunit D
MRGQGRMTLAKGLLQAYLKESYLRRDRVGLVAFRHDRSRLVLPLTPNMRRAERVVAQLPVGGKTPLAEGMALGLRALLQERYRNPDTDTIMVLVSDGKPNLSLHGGDPLDEALMVAERVAQNRTTLVFIDTEDDPLAFGYGPQVAQAAGGVYRTMASLIRGWVV